MELKKIYKLSKKSKKLSNERYEFRNLSSVFIDILRDDRDFSIFPKYVSSSLSKPLDFQFPISNRKESCERLIFTFLKRNEINNALYIFIHLIFNYNPPTSFVWRTGFHILNRFDDQILMNKFFNAMLQNTNWDPSNMIYEYFLYLLERKDYSRIRNIYYFSGYPKIYQNKRYKREPEMEKIHHLIKLLVALTFYCSWKESLLVGQEDESSLIQAELEFSELDQAIKNKMVVDSFLINYIDLLTHLNKFEKALNILQLYHKIMNNNINAVNYLLNFLVLNEQFLPDVSKKYIAEIREEFVIKQLVISPKSNRFILAAFRKHIEELDKESEHEKIVKLLFNYLCKPSWVDVEWPWKYLLNSVQFLSAANQTVQESWKYIRSTWINVFFKCPSNPFIASLSKILD